MLPLSLLAFRSLAFSWRRTALLAVAVAAGVALDFGAALTVDGLDTPFVGIAGPVVLVSGFFFMLNAFTLVTDRRRREIGLLRAAGATSRQVMGAALLEAGLVGIPGIALGLALGVALAAALALWPTGSRLVLPPAPATLRAAGFSVTLGLLATAMAALIVARPASRQPLAAALRPGWPLRERADLRPAALGLVAGIGSLPLVLGDFPSAATVTAGVLLLLAAAAVVLQPLLLPLTTLAALLVAAVWPAEARLAREQILRRPRRSVRTMAGVVVSLALIGALGTMEQAVPGSGHRSLRALSLMAALLGMLAGVSGLLIHLQDGRREIALLRAVGMTRRQARRMLLAQAGMLTGCGGFAGSVAGVLLGAALVHAGSSPGADVHYAVPTGWILAGICGVVLGTLAGTALPRRAASQDGVLRALRYE